ncbi:MAG TPA: hypothetical protein DCY97_02680 [Marinilabiliales bacterium]|nr:hypothetical protein [Marinilabiliales bacterium]
MKNKELKQFRAGLESCKSMSSKVGYAVGKNMRLLEKEVEYLYTDARRRPEGWKEYEEKEITLIRTYAVSFQNGQPFFGDNTPTFNTELQKLQTEYKKILEADRPMQLEWEKFMDEESSVELVKIKQSDIPENATAEQIYALDPIIEN